MEDKGEVLHTLLARQLKRNGLENIDLPADKKGKWDHFLLSISRAYKNYEQDLYILERSMTLSSTELMDLNEKLESAQNTAHLGYWRYDRTTDALFWSKEMFGLTGFDINFSAPPLTQVLSNIPEEERICLKKAFEKAFEDGKEFSLECSFKNLKDGQYYYHHVKGHPDLSSVDSDSGIRYLTGIVMDITERKKHEKEIEKTHQQLISISRKAGMSEVATSILHNIGNILNSANVSMSIVIENHKLPYFSKLFKIKKFFQENLNNLPFYLTEDPKGKLIPTYLIELIGTIEKNYEAIMQELTRLSGNLLHIKEIVTMQRAISGISGVREKIFLPDVVETALQMTKNASHNIGIKIRKKFEKVPFIEADKSKVLQILINLLTNAKAAVLQNVEHKSGDIDIIIRNEKDQILLIVQDNGVGIPLENLEKIFSFGFTTKKDGHGFGLHGSALMAREFGGTLKAKSAGPGKGASFTLTIPLMTSELLQERD